MLKAYWNDKIIFSFDIKNIYGYKDYSVEKEYRLAGHKGELKCIDCGDVVILKSGDKKVPHFAHKTRNYSCENSNKDSFESEEHKLGNQILFNFFREKEEYDLLDIDHKFDFGRRANIYIENSENKIAVEYVVNPMNHIEWIKKQKDYLDNKIIPIWVLSRVKFSEMSNEDYNFFEKTIEISDFNGILYTLDTESNLMYFAKYMENIKNDKTFKREVYKKSYLISEVKYDKKYGFSSHNFLDEFVVELSKFNSKCDVEYQKIQEDFVKLNEKKELLLQEIEIIDEDKNSMTEHSLNDLSSLNFQSEKISSISSENRWGYCIDCGEYTNEWWYFDPPDKCKCYCTIKK